MAKAPAFQFYPNDFLRDTLELSLAATGGWAKLLCKMWYSVTPGRISMPIASYARMFGSVVDQAQGVIDELIDFGICDAVTESNANVTLTNRRMFREWEEREAARLRQQRHRSRIRDGTNDDVSHNTDDTVTPYSSSSSSFSTSSSKEDLKRLIETCVRAHVDKDERLVEVAVLETLYKWKGNGKYKPKPIKSISYFTEEIGHMDARREGLPLDVMLAIRRPQVEKALFGHDNAGPS